MKLLPETPYLQIDLGRISQAYLAFKHAMPDITVHYAMKCNSDERILAHLASMGCSFEIASWTELEQLIRIGVDPASVIYSNPVKPPAHIAQAHGAGVWRYAFDSQAEADKLAAIAPGAAVYVRLAALPEDSSVPSEGKFGIAAEEAVRLMQYARQKGLRPYGIAFHVGSQMERTAPWAAAIREAAAIMRRLEADGIRLKMLDIGGGFPAHYSRPIPSIMEYGETIRHALASHLPYSLHITAEPGRYLVAEAGVLVTTVIGVAERSGKTWLHLDAGAFNGLMEALETRNQLLYPVTDSLAAGHKQLYHLTGPSCDSQDTLLYDAELSNGLATGDNVYIKTAGAYTTSYASTFNGFAIPETIVADVPQKQTAASMLL